MSKAFSLSPRDQQRYARHLSLSQVGTEGQIQLKQASVLVVGAGGLGCPILQYLTATGIGKLGIADADRVSFSNLQRQILYREADLGALKVEAAAKHLKALNADITIVVHPEHLSRNNALSIIEQYDIIVDGTDNFPTRYLLNDACVLVGKTYVYGSVFRFEGQVAVFNHQRSNGERGPNYRDLYPSPPPPGQIPNCAEDGILGILPGTVGCLQATEVIKIILNIGDILDGQLLLVDLLSGRQHRMHFNKRDNYLIQELIDYEQFCGIPSHEAIPTIDADALSNILQTSTLEVSLIDVRQQEEYERDNLGGHLIPLSELEDHIPRLAKTEKTLIIHCQSGKRSLLAVEQLLAAGIKNVFHLEGGLNAYRTKNN